MNTQAWQQQIQMNRKSKDAFFKHNWQSPLPPKIRQAFEGLVYYPLDSAYRFEVDLIEYPVEKQEVIEIEDTGNNLRKFYRVGEFHFSIPEQGEAVLFAYKGHLQDDTLFVPFRDATSGKTTYGAGRYLDLEEGRDQTPDGQWIVDFNQAYNPYCAYSENYVCPFVPIENWLKVAIEAGEKTFAHQH